MTKNADPAPDAPASLKHLVGDVLNAAHRAFGKTWPPQAKECVRKHAKRYRKELLKLEAAQLRGRKHQVRRRSFMVEHSYSCRFCAFLLGYPKSGKALTLAQAKKLSEQVNLRKPSVEKVRVREMEKPEGGKRVIMAFGPRDRAAKWLADSILRAIWGISPYEYSRQGRGRDAAIRETIHSFNEGGARRIIKVDIKGFYPSVDMEKLEPLIPLPLSVIRTTLRIPKTKAIDLSLAPTTSENAVRMGLITGSRPSALIASRVFEPMLQNLPGARLALNHGDDGIVTVRTDEQAETVKMTLALRATEHPCGPFKLKELEILRMGTVHDILGYMLRHRAKIYGGGARISVSPKAILRFQRKLARYLALRPISSWEQIAEKKCRGWVASFGQWKHDGSVVDIALQELEDEVYPVLIAFQKHVKGKGFPSFADLMKLFDADFLPSIGKQWKTLKGSAA